MTVDDDFDCSSIEFPGRGTIYSASPHAENQPGDLQQLAENPLESLTDYEVTNAIPAPLHIHDGLFLGIDWSGAAKAGKKIWAAMLRVESGRMRVVWLNQPFRAFDAANVAARFAAWLQENDFVVAGLDFCFGISTSHQLQDLPRGGPIEVGSWVAANFPTPESFKAALGREAKRNTDIARKSPSLLQICECIDKLTGDFER